MSIAGLEPVYQQFSNQKTGSADSKDELGMNQFLTMLVAQLKHQDPLNPMEGTDFTAQLAQFSGLEQQFAMNAHLAEMQAAIEAQGNGNVLDYIGKTVTTNNNTISIRDGQTDSGAYTLGSHADVNVYVYDENGIEVRRMYVGWQDAGKHNIDWDGKDNSGNTVDDGTYTFEIEAVGEMGQIVSSNTHVMGEVTGITYESDMPYLMIGDKLLSPSEIVEVEKTMVSD